MRYFIEISYRGTGYSGWQVQKNHSTIQGRLNEAVSDVLQSEIKCVGASRTDAGVHARQNFAQFDVDSPLPDVFLKRVNQILPADIAVSRVIPVKDDQHVRHDARQRSYEYYLHFRKTPLLAGLSYLCPYPQLDFHGMKKVASLLPHYTDFSMLSRRDAERDTICHIKSSSWTVNELTGQWVYHVSADRFLWGMVRRLVGLMVMIGHNRVTLHEFEENMIRAARFRVNYKVPPEGLYLTEVKYKFAL
jgi:tRNA pseudouridine38-40 synthase